MLPWEKLSDQIGRRGGKGRKGGKGVTITTYEFIVLNYFTIIYSLFLVTS